MKGQRKNKHSIAIKIIIFFLFVLICIGLTFVIGYFHYTQGLPELTSLEGYKPHAVSKIYGDDGQLIGQYYLENRIVIPVNKMPQKLMEAFIAAEDARFFEHSGVDLFSILRATIKNVMAGEIIQGGSTITQQLVKSFFLTSEKSLSRKIKEAILAYRVENFLTKREILYLYLNQIYLGNGAYGVETASQSYFGKHVYELNLAEIAMLAGLPKAPSVFAPTVNFEKSLERQNYVLERMQKNGYITNDEMEDAKKKEIKIIPKEKRLFSKAPYFTEYIKQYVTQKYGEDLFYKGLKIYTPLSPAMQQVAEQAVRKGLLKLDKRQGFRGPIKRITVKEMNSFCTNQSAEFEKSGISFGKTYEGVVISSDKKTHKVVVQIGGYIGSISKRSGQWALRKNHLNIKTHSFAELFDTGHVIYVKVNSYNKKSHTLNLSLEQEPEVEAALISIDPRTGYIKSLVGGRDFFQSQFNRAIYAKRQAGSAFKPIIYAAALDKGYTLSTIIIDEPTEFKWPGGDWNPQNYDNEFSGPTTFRNGLCFSKNVVTVKILQDIGIDYARRYARKMGIVSPIPRNLSVGLGSADISPLELTCAYAVFANQGYKISPIFIKKILTFDGNVLEENSPSHIPTFTSFPILEKLYNLEDKDLADILQIPPGAISRQTAYIMTDLLMSVISDGTGRVVKPIGRPCAGKTGTTNDNQDAWFVGYTPNLCTGVWVGHDNRKSLGDKETGARAAAPIWLHFMKKILSDNPIEIFPIPPGIIFIRVNPDLGILTDADDQNGIFEPFKVGSTLPPTTPIKIEPETEIEHEIDKLHGEESETDLTLWRENNESSSE